VDARFWASFEKFPQRHQAQEGGLAAFPPSQNVDFYFFLKNSLVLLTPRI
jgi:hypothetical protein